METPQTYRLQAELCLRQAEHAKTPEHRASLLEMTQTWLRLADWATTERAALVIPKGASASHSACTVIEPRPPQH